METPNLKPVHSGSMRISRAIRSMPLSALTSHVRDRSRLVQLALTGPEPQLGELGLTIRHLFFFGSCGFHGRAVATQV